MTLIKWIHLSVGLHTVLAVIQKQLSGVQDVNKNGIVQGWIDLLSLLTIS